MSFGPAQRRFWQRALVSFTLVAVSTSFSGQPQPTSAAATLVTPTTAPAVDTPRIASAVSTPSAVLVTSPPTTEPNLLPESGPFAVAAGQPLPTDAECAARVTKTAEVVPGNTAANHKTGKAGADTYRNWGNNPTAIAFSKRVSGNFTGTTDELIQWASCKWGFDPDPVRAQVMVESSWHQSSVAGFVPDAGKCTHVSWRRPITTTTTTSTTTPLIGAAVGALDATTTSTTAAPTTSTSSTVPADGSTTTSTSTSTTLVSSGFECPTAFGLLQIRSDYQPGTYPMSQRSTAFNLDYSLAMKRACYEGVGWLGSQTKGDAWGCVGVHYSGSWLDSAAKDYIAKVQRITAAKAWRH